MSAIVRPATVKDCFSLAPRLSARDVAELAAVGAAPLGALVNSYNESALCWSAHYDGEVQCMFGVAPSPLRPGLGVPWLLGSERLHEFGHQFCRVSPGYIAQMHELFPSLMNYVHALNTASIVWLYYLGFQFTNVFPVGEHLFIQFEKSVCAT